MYSGTWTSHRLESSHNINEQSKYGTHDICMLYHTHYAFFLHSDSVCYAVVTETGLGTT